MTERHEAQPKPGGVSMAELLPRTSRHHRKPAPLIVFTLKDAIAAWGGFDFLRDAREEYRRAAHGDGRNQST